MSFILNSFLFLRVVLHIYRRNPKLPTSPPPSFHTLNSIHCVTAPMDYASIQPTFPFDRIGKKIIDKVYIDESGEFLKEIDR